MSPAEPPGDWKQNLCEMGLGVYTRAGTMASMIYNRTRVAVSVIALAALASQAPRPDWVPVGPPGGDVRSLAADPRDPRGSTSAPRTASSTDPTTPGAHWQRLAPGFPQRGLSLDDIVVDPRGVVFVGYWEVARQGRRRGPERGRRQDLHPPARHRAARRCARLAIAPSNPTCSSRAPSPACSAPTTAGRPGTRITPAGHADLRNVDSRRLRSRGPERDLRRHLAPRPGRPPTAGALGARSTPG